MKRIYNHLIYSLFLLILTFPSIHATITVIGTGYVGLVTGACLASLGNHVICVDIDENKIALLQAGIIPIYEPGLQEIVNQEVTKGTLFFTTDIKGSLKESDIIFIAVGTYTNSDGSADLSAFNSALNTIASCLDHPMVIVTKSTVPVGTHASIKKRLEQVYKIDKTMFELVSNPEFLREGSAVSNFLNPDRLIIGIESQEAREKMEEIYKALVIQQIPIIWTDLHSAEMIKYASNIMLALKLSFINEIANLCDATGANIKEVTQGMGLDPRIGPYFLNPGPGFGGSCFPKDSLALLHTAQKFNITLYTVQALLHTNHMQRKKPFEKLQKLMNNDIKGKTIGLLGLAFKANTDDVRESAAIDTITLLVEQGAHVRAYDPVAMANMQKIFPSITYCSSAYETLQGSDAAIILTEWDEFKSLDLQKAAAIMKHAIIVDARNILDAVALKDTGFLFDFIGQSSLQTKNKLL